MRSFVVVGNGVVELLTGSLGVDEEGGVKQDPAQDRSCSSATDRTAVRSSLHRLSGRLRRRTSLTSASCPSLTGCRLAITLPRRTIVKRSPRYSTASSKSAELRAASVAVTSDTGSDCLMWRPSAASSGRDVEAPQPGDYFIDSCIAGCPAYARSRPAEGSFAHVQRGAFGEHPRPTNRAPSRSICDRTGAQANVDQGAPDDQFGHAPSRSWSLSLWDATPRQDPWNPLPDSAGYLPAGRRQAATHRAVPSTPPARERRFLARP